MKFPKPIKSAIFDSGPLLLALSLNYINKNYIQNDDEFLKLAYGKPAKIPTLKLTLEKFFNKFNKIYTTPHVIGELKGLVKSRLKLKDNEYKFWIQSIDYLKRKNLSEKLLTLVELSDDSNYKNLIPSIGFVDTELIKLAFELKPRLTIISIDGRTLKREANKKIKGDNNER